MATGAGGVELRYSDFWSFGLLPGRITTGSRMSDNKLPLHGRLGSHYPQGHKTVEQ
jgi:hypothetical protein